MAKSDSSTSKKSKSKPVSKLSHDLFASGSYEEDDSAGDLFSPVETSKAMPTATPTGTAASSGRKDVLFAGAGNKLTRMVL